jgi:glucose-1-phosphate cytidylyltransferase
MPEDRVQTVLLCGGRGTRLREFTEAIPKVLVEVGGRPILWHIMKTYSHYGFDDFVLALGYLGDRVKQYFLDQHAWRGRDLRLRLNSGAEPEPLGTGLGTEKWDVIFGETGLDTNTGGRIKRLRQYIQGDVFFATYGDGVADLDLRALLAFHRSHGRIATVTAVKPHLTFGVLDVQQNQVRGFQEKPQLDRWINGGFFVFDQRVFDYLEDDSVLEQEPLERLAAQGELMAYSHEGFWACMDTYKDNERLNQLWSTNRAPWKVWE